MALKKEENYFDMFVESVDFSLEVAEKLLDLVTDFTDIERKVNEIHEIEHRADDHFHVIFEQLSKAFITPLEREDILLLSQSIDNLTDSIESIAFSFYMMDIQAMRDDVVPFVQLITKSFGSLKIALQEFKKYKKSQILTSKIIDVNNVEEEGDRFYHSAVNRLFREEKNAIEIIKWREIYDGLENCLDACEDVADNLEGVVLKNS